MTSPCDSSTPHTRGACRLQLRRAEADLQQTTMAPLHRRFHDALQSWPAIGGPHSPGRGGISILQLARPHADGRIDVDLGESESSGHTPADAWRLKTRNVRRIRVVLPVHPAQHSYGTDSPRSLILDYGAPISILHGTRLLHLCAATTAGLSVFAVHALEGVSPQPCPASQ